MTNAFLITACFYPERRVREKKIIFLNNKAVRIRNYRVRVFNRRLLFAG